ncbi:MAG: hypothetical protein H6739_33765 [Alphaproteobacteria bacterium]|nr:hypothetical protein [Alphaproteobacteria bacterium]
MMELSILFALVAVLACALAARQHIRISRYLLDLEVSAAKRRALLADLESANARLREGEAESLRVATLANRMSAELELMEQALVAESGRVDHLRRGLLVAHAKIGTLSDTCRILEANRVRLKTIVDGQNAELDHWLEERSAMVKELWMLRLAVQRRGAKPAGARRGQERGRLSTAALRLIK